MKSDLEWNVDEDDREPPWRAKQIAPPPRQGWRGWWRWALGAIILAAAVGLPVWWFSRNANRAVDEQREAVLHAARLEEQLARSGDMDALSTLQDGLYPGGRQWQKEQREPRLFQPKGAAGLVYGLDWGNSTLSQYVAIGDPVYGVPRLSGQEATLVITHEYSLVSEPSRSFALGQIAYYRFIDGGWVHTEAPANVWSAMLANSSDQINLLYPSFDAETLKPLAPRLAAIAGRACAIMGCPQGAPHLTITGRGEDLLRPAAPDAPIYAPSPSLVGTPEDEAGTDALFRLYAIRLVTGMGTANGLGEPAIQTQLVLLGLERP